jgi:hypothetical protein
LFWRTVAVDLKDIDPGLGEGGADAGGGSRIAVHTRGQQSWRVAAPGMENAVTPGAAAGIGSAWFGRQAWIVNRVLLALVADTPVADATLQDSRGDHKFCHVQIALRGKFAQQ